MQLFRHYQSFPADLRGAVVAIGNFDGVHRGHQIVLAEARSQADRLGTGVTVLSFEPHPRSVFRPEDPPFRLTPFRIRARLLEELGVEVHMVLPFDVPFSHLSAEAFVRDILVGATAAGGLGAAHVVIGHDFCFGHQRQGNAQTLQGYGDRFGFGVSVVTKASDEEGGVYSSTGVRQLLREGKPRQAAEMLGRPWEVEGRVEHGDKRGRELGFPTANIDLDEYLRPAFGIYAIRAAIDTGPAPTWHDGVANLGIRPMYLTERPLLEAHLFDFSGDLYGRHLRVQIVDFLRPEATFDGIAALIDQIDRDAAQARAVLTGLLDQGHKR